MGDWNGLRSRGKSDAQSVVDFNILLQFQNLPARVRMFSIWAGRGKLVKTLIVVPPMGLAAIGLGPTLFRANSTFVSFFLRRCIRLLLLIWDNPCGDACHSVSIKSVLRSASIQD